MDKKNIIKIALYCIICVISAITIIFIAKHNNKPAQEQKATEKKAEDACIHEWEYADNKDGTHTKTCVKCGEKRQENHYPEPGLGSYRCKFCHAWMHGRADFFTDKEQMRETRQEEENWYEEAIRNWEEK